MSNKLNVILLIALTLEIDNAFCNDKFSLPSNKTTTVSCQEATLAKHNGEISSEKTIHLPAGKFEIHFEINDKESADWLVICDGLTGKILKDIKLDKVTK